MKDYRINKEIDSDFIRLRDENDLISYSEALKIAIENNVDLIEISTYISDKQISVCILQDYQKFLYQQRKREKELKANQVKIVIKELRFGLQIDKHDYDVKLKQAKNFLNSKFRVKISILFKGREITFKNKGEILLLQLATDLENISKVDEMPKLEGKRMFLTLIPK